MLQNRKDSFFHHCCTSCLLIFFTIRTPTPAVISSRIVFSAVDIPLAVVLPFYLVVINSFKTKGEAARMNLSLPTEWQFSNYTEAAASSSSTGTDEIKFRIVNTQNGIMALVNTMTSPALVLVSWKVPSSLERVT